MLADSVLESPGAQRFAEESTTAADGVGGGERLATTVGESTETLGAMAGAAESSKVEAGAVDVTMPNVGVGLYLGLEPNKIYPGALEPGKLNKSIGSASNSAGPRATRSQLVRSQESRCRRRGALPGRRPRAPCLCLW